MDLNNYRSYIMSEEKEKRMWEAGIFAFDTSALLAFYYFSENTRKDIFSEIFSRLKGRLWIPGHVEYEFLKNRENTLKKPISEGYDKIKTDDLEKIKSTISSLSGLIKNLNQKVSKQDKHPFIDNKIISQLNDFAEETKEKYDQLNTDILKEFDKRTQEIEAALKHDMVLEQFQNYFTAGKEYDFDTMMEIVKEGKIRYENCIPPGYKDETKKGIQKYGDLIIWKQIIDYAKKTNKPIFFITDDITKEDSCYIKKRSNETRIISPYEEMIKEMYDKAHAEFWMYTFSQFLYKAKIFGNLQISDQMMEEVKDSVKVIQKLKFNGMYVHISDVTVAKIKRFFSDGKVVSVSVAMKPDDQTPEGRKDFLYGVSRWLDYNYKAAGHYQVDKNHISFYSESEFGRVDYNGYIEEDKLVLNWYSHINGNRGQGDYYFYEINQ